VGASNLSRLPLIMDNRVQVDSYPGCNIAHATYLLRNKTPTSPSTNTVILHFGLNDKSRSNPTLLIQDLRRLLTAAAATFPYADIRMPIINISPKLDRIEKRNLEQINQLIGQNRNAIPSLAKRLFNTTNDGIHWTPSTAAEMWKHWKACLNWGSQVQQGPP